MHTLPNTQVVLQHQAVLGRLQVAVRGANQLWRAFCLLSGPGVLRAGVVAEQCAHGNGCMRALALQVGRGLKQSNCCSKSKTFIQYLQAVPMLFLWETKRKDRLEVFAHHVATIVLISYSYYLK
jgi:hypothetical protein